MKSKIIVVLSVFVSLVVVLWFAELAAASSLETISAPLISNLQVVTTDVARYERFEVQFDVQTVSDNPDLPYAPYPPPGVEPEIGVTVNAHFSSDNWGTEQIQPAFYNQSYVHSLHNGVDHLTPDGASNWTVRFAPQEAGEWQFRLCATDSGGVTCYPDLGSPALTFNVDPISDNEYTRRGFLQASPIDPRYFEFSDGTPFVGVGFNDNFREDNFVTVDAKMTLYEENKMNFMRVWMSSFGINGSHWTSWRSHSLPYDGYLPRVHFDTEIAYGGADFSMVLDDVSPCSYSDFGQRGIPIEPGITYNLSARVKLDNVTGPIDPGGAYGFVVKQASWLGADHCDEPNNGVLITTPVIGSTDWITLTGSYTTGSSQHWLDFLYLTRQNATGGTIYVDDVRVWRADDPIQVNLLREPNANSHTYFDPMNAAQWDHFIQSAEQHGVYLKLVIDDRSEWLRNHIDASGESVPTGSNDNFYAAPDTKVRWLQQAWWRYIIARWGYSTAIHSFEYTNEGDPYNGHHYEAANSMACYFDDNDPSQHMVTTSVWSGFPAMESWINPSYSCIDYADIHAYISNGWGAGDDIMPSWLASFLRPSLTETDLAYVHGGSASARITATLKVNTPINPRGVVIQGEGEWVLRYWMKAESFSATCTHGPAGGKQRVRWMLDGGRYHGGLEGVTPTDIQGREHRCTSPDGTYDWTQFTSQFDRFGNPIPAEYRIIIADMLPHELSLRLENSDGTAGVAWIDDVELVNPHGDVLPIIGQFDITSMDEDAAWYNYAYAYIWGNGSPVKEVIKPVVRGEAGISLRDEQVLNPDLLLDTEGIWLHNNVWAQVNAGAMPDLFWWAEESILPSFYYHYLTFRNFMEDIPLNNGNYRDISTQLSDESLRAWGQRDDFNGHIHLWIQNEQNTWRNVVDGVPITPISGTVIVLDVPAGNYVIQWWDTYATSDPVFLTEIVASDGNLTLTLPYALEDDVAVKITSVISNLDVVTDDVARYERFEIQFDVLTLATDLDLPYDLSPPAGIEPEIGVTVNAHFSSDNWATEHIQPAFHNQPYIHSLYNERDHLTPDGAPNWVVRFAPQDAGEWQFRLCVTDTLGTTWYPDLGSPALTFSVDPTSDNEYTRRGFLQVSPTDPRYFEFANGTPFVGVGFNDSFKSTNSEAVDAKMALYEENKMNFMRVWMSSFSINGSHWTSWHSHFLDNDDYLPGVHFDTETTYNGADFSMMLDDLSPCSFSDFGLGGIPVEPSTTYTVSARVKLDGVDSPIDPGSAYGFVLKQATWLGTSCAEPNNGTLITTPVIGSTDWITLTGSYTTGSSQHWLDYLYLTRQNVTDGTVYVDDVRVWRADDPAQVNILREPNANSHTYFDPMNAAQWDRFIQSAEQHGVYLKLTIDEKNEWLRNHIDDSGESMPTGSNDNFYASPDTKVRWLQEAWWRYIIARWGYSTAIHSFEYVNEGDPYNGNHYEAANSMACYFDDNDPSQHMVTTSFWHSFPAIEFWLNPDYSCIDYAEIHAYISNGWGDVSDETMPSWLASFLPPSLTETDPLHIHSGNASARITATLEVNTSIAPRGVAIQGEGEWVLRYWMKAENFSATCAFGPAGGKQRVRWMLDGGRYNGGLEGVTPTDVQRREHRCTSLDGTYDWTQFNSQYDRFGVPIPAEYRIIITDTLPHELSLRLENSDGITGTAWIDDVELVSPSGEILPVIGQFDITPMDDDSAWYNYAYAYIWGNGSPVKEVLKPVVRSEAGITPRDEQVLHPDLVLDTDGIWLHNNVWAQVNAGAMPDLFWWASDTITPSIYSNYLTFRNFMEDIPLNNGNYADISTQLSDESLRAWGQQDDVNGCIHLWIQNKQHTWRNVVDGVPIAPISGTVMLLDVPAGSYSIQWWNTYLTSDPIFLEEIVVSDGNLTLNLPYPLADDVAVKISSSP